MPFINHTDQIASAERRGDGTQRRVRRPFTVRALLAVLIVVATLGTLTTPASAAVGGATVRVNDAGDLLVVFRQDHVGVEINSISTGSYAVWVTTHDGDMEIHNVHEVTRNVIINYRNHRHGKVEIGYLQPTQFPQDLRSVSLGGSTDYADNRLFAKNVEIGDDLVARGDLSVKLHGSTVGDDVNATSLDSGILNVQLLDASTVRDRVIARARGSAGFGIVVAKSIVGSLRAYGGPALDQVSINQANLGTSPFVSLAAGDDLVSVTDSAWSGTFRYNGADGDDALVFSKAPAVQTFEAVLGPGADRFWIGPDLPGEGEGMTLHGGGQVDTVHTGSDLSEATLVSIQDIIEIN